MVGLSSMVEIVVGSISVLLLLLLSIVRQRKAPELTDAVTIFISGLGVVGGVQVCVVSFSSKLPEGMAGYRAYIFLAGLAVLWVSAGMIWRLLAKTWHTASTEGGGDTSSRRK